MTITATEIPTTTNKELEQQIVAHLDDLTKPPGSLGRLEEIVRKYCLCRGDLKPSLESKKVFTFAGDHGIAAEKITPFPPEVTPQMVLNMTRGGAAVCVMCRKAGVEYSVVDMGVNAEQEDHPGLIRRKVRKGTRNFAVEPAMTHEECVQAIETGIVLAGESGADILGAGEMGICNTASASALYSMLLDLDPSLTVGPGTGSAGELLEHKKRVVSRAVRRHCESWDGSAFQALERVGGYEIAGMVGLMLGGAARRIPVVVDGFISSAAALVAMRIDPVVKEYLFFSHASAETFHESFLAREGIRPLLALDMRLGEGTGAVLALQLIEQALACYHEMATFSSAGVAGKEE